MIDSFLFTYQLIGLCIAVLIIAVAKQRGIDRDEKPLVMIGAYALVTVACIWAWPAVLLYTINQYGDK